MTDFTKKGYKLEHETGLAFVCQALGVVWAADAPQRTNLFLARLVVFAPCTRGQIVSALRAWLAVYGDDELVDQVDAVADEALEKMVELSAAGAVGHPQKNQAN